MNFQWCLIDDVHTLEELAALRVQLFNITVLCMNYPPEVVQKQQAVPLYMHAQPVPSRGVQRATETLPTRRLCAVGALRSAHTPELDPSQLEACAGHAFTVGLARHELRGVPRDLRPRVCPRAPGPDGRVGPAVPLVGARDGGLRRDHARGLVFA